VNSLEEDGYVVITGACISEACSALKEIDQLVRLNPKIFPSDDDFSHLDRVANLHLVVKSLIDCIGASSEVLDVQRQFFRETPTIHTSLYFRHGSRQALHVDSPYFTTVPYGRYLGCWIALEDATVENGCLMVIPGGHHFGILRPEEFIQSTRAVSSEIRSIDQAIWESWQFENSKRWGNSEPIPVEVPAGTVIIWHPSLPHGGWPIHKSSDCQPTRQSVVFHTTPVNQAVYHLDTFFNPEINREPLQPIKYEYHAGWPYRIHNTISLQHVDDISVDEFVTGKVKG
jgi:hypothetical protein